MPIQFNNKRICMIEGIEGFTPSISSLISMMRYARNVTLGVTKGLSTQQLDFLQDENSNSIGMLLFHIAATEKWYQNYTFENREGFNNAESGFWEKGSFEDREKTLTIKGNNLDYYRELLKNVREETYLQFQKRDDFWLKSEINIEGNDFPENNWFRWFHVFEDEINHRGQISWLRKRLPK